MKLKEFADSVADDRLKPFIEWTMKAVEQYEAHELAAYVPERDGATREIFVATDEGLIEAREELGEPGAPDQVGTLRWTMTVRPWRDVEGVGLSYSSFPVNSTGTMVNVRMDQPEFSESRAAERFQALNQFGKTCHRLSEAHRHERARGR